jgi:hypothetical protein
VTAEVNIPDEAVDIVAGQLLSNPDVDVEREKALMALQDAAPLIVAEARRQWETEQLEQLRAEVHDISNARHIHVQRGVDRFVDRNYGNVGEDKITKRYQHGVNQWNDDHPALLALWQRYNALVETAELRGGQ